MCQVRLQVKYSLSGLDLRRTQPSHSWLFAARGAKPVESDGEYPRQFHGGRTCNVAENTRAHSASLGAGVPDFVGSLGSRFNLTEVGTSPKTPERTPHGQVNAPFSVQSRCGCLRFAKFCHGARLLRRCACSTKPASVHGKPCRLILR